MLTKEDKNWITGKFATKDDLKKFATKDDLKAFATKAELSIIKDDVKELKVDSKLLQKAVIRLERGMEENIVLSKKIIATNEGWAGKVAVLDQENKMGSITLRRHGIQIHELATATGTVVSE